MTALDFFLSYSVSKITLSFLGLNIQSQTTMELSGNEKQYFKLADWWERFHLQKTGNPL
jgi:hypothetical protein